MYRKFGLLAVAALMTLTACSGTTAQHGDQPAGPAFPVTIEHKLGTTEIKSAPKRVVTLGLSDHDAVVALGVKPVGVIDWFKERPWGKWAWLDSKISDARPEVVGERDEYNMEKIAALKPDLILALYAGIKKEQYDTLSQIAPVVAQVKGFEDFGAPWQEMAKVVGKALGKGAEMDGLIKELDAKYAAVKARHPEWQGKTLVVAEAYTPGKFAVFAPHDPKVKFFAQLGFAFPEAVAKEVGKTDVVDFSLEQVDRLEADRVVWLADTAGAEKFITNEPLYQKLNVAKEKRDVVVSYQEPPMVGGALSFNTVLSIPFALDNIEKVLAR